MIQDCTCSPTNPGSREGEWNPRCPTHGAADPGCRRCGHPASLHEDGGPGACQNGHPNGGWNAVEPYTVTCGCDRGEYEDLSLLPLESDIPDELACQSRKHTTRVLAQDGTLYCSACWDEAMTDQEMQRW